MIIMESGVYYKSVEILKYNDNQRVSITNIKYSDARIFLSNRFLIVIISADGDNVHNVFNLSEIKAYKTSNKLCY